MHLHDLNLHLQRTHTHVHAHTAAQELHTHNILPHKIQIERSGVQNVVIWHITKHADPCLRKVYVKFNDYAQNLESEEVNLMLSLSTPSCHMQNLVWSLQCPVVMS